MAQQLKLYKISQRRLADDVIKKQINYAVCRSLASGRGKVWSTTRPRIDYQEQGGQHVYTAVIGFKRIGRDVSADVQERQVDKMREMAAGALRSKGWTLQINGNGEPHTNEEANQDETIVQPPTVNWATVELSIDPKNHFSHLYGLDAQIELVLSSVREYVRSDRVNRFHTVLHGSPASGKTDVLRSLTKVVGEEAVLHFDATSTTAAGAKQLLTESRSLPPILAIEEIEKTDESSLRWLLGVLDYRAEVRALKFRSGLVAREVKLLCLATVNDYTLFNRMMDGALASRFSHKIHCPRPSRDVLRLILERELLKSGGDASWVDPALDWCIDEEKTNDPRRALSICLCGRERLLTGEYQKTLKATMEPK